MTGNALDWNYPETSAEAQWALNDVTKHANDLKTALTTAMISPNSSNSHSPSSSPAQVKKPSKKKDPTRIKKPMNSFFLYRKRMRERIIAEHKVTAHQQISKIAATLWASEPASVKKQFQIESLEEFERHKKLHPDYQWPHRGTKNVDACGSKHTHTRRSRTKTLPVKPIFAHPDLETAPRVIMPTPLRSDGNVCQDPSHIITAKGTILIPLNQNKSHYPCPHGSCQRSHCFLCGGSFTCIHLKRKDFCKTCFNLPKGICLHGYSQIDCNVCKYREVCRHYCDPALCFNCYSDKSTELKLAPITLKEDTDLNPLQQLATAAAKFKLPSISSLLFSAKPSVLTNTFTPPRQDNDGKTLIPFYEYEGECVHKLQLSKCFLCEMDSTCVHMESKRKCRHCQALPREMCLHRMKMYDCDICRYREVVYPRTGKRQLPTPAPTPTPIQWP